jgi:ABC transporter substrate binding protein
MKRRDFITLLGGAAACPLARAQHLKAAQIGVLVLTNADGQSLTRELRLGLRDFGYSEGQNFVFQLRSSDGDVARLPQLATELVSSHVDVVVATFTPCALAAKQATTRDGCCCGTRNSAPSQSRARHNNAAPLSRSREAVTHWRPLLSLRNPAARRRGDRPFINGHRSAPSTYEYTSQHVRESQRIGAMDRAYRW